MTCFRCEELERLLGLREDFPPEWKLTPTMTQVLGMLLKRDFCSAESIYTAVWGSRPDSDLPDTNIVSVYICKLRRRLSPHGISILTYWGRGFYVDSENKRRLRDLCAQREAA